MNKKELNKIVAALNSTATMETLVNFYYNNNRKRPRNSLEVTHDQSFGKELVHRWNNWNSVKAQLKTAMQALRNLQKTYNRQEKYIQTLENELRNKGYNEQDFEQLQDESY